jgi:formylglycine-generating enzyme required for sulfatase activity
MLGSQVTLHATLTIPLVPVGNPGNANDGTGFGSVGVEYFIGKYEVTNMQYTEFLNTVDPTGVNSLGLYSNNMTDNGNGGIDHDPFAGNGSKYSVKTGRDNNPVVFVSWYSALRFANWMHNGQGSGSTEDGAYTLLGGTPATVSRNPGATWFLPNENEWYKAAYYDADTAAYFAYPTETNATPVSDEPAGGDGGSDATNAANFQKNDMSANSFNDGYAATSSPAYFSTQNYLTDVGAYVSADGPHGTFDQGGNAAEWTESSTMSGLERIIRGGDWFHNESDLIATFWDSELPTAGVHTIGFRLAAIPEPSSVLLIGLVGSLVGLAHFFANRRAR